VWIHGKRRLYPFATEICPVVCSGRRSATVAVSAQQAVFQSLAESVDVSIDIERNNFAINSMR
jgi:hypothetical protein